MAKNPLTANGRIKLDPRVNRTRLNKVKSLYEAHQEGDGVAMAQLMEVLTTSDGSANFAHLATMNFLPNYDKADRIWTQVAGVRDVPDFNAVRLWTLAMVPDNGDGDGAPVLGEHGEAPTIPEAAPYPYVYITGQSEQSGSVTKKGFKTDWTLESRINDGMGVIDELPRMMLEASLDTEESEVFTPLSTAGVALAGGTVPTGATVPANAALSRDALIRAQMELVQRTINDRKITVNGGYNLLVAPGQGIYANFILNQTLTGFEKSSDPKWIYQVTGTYNPLANISVLETDWLSSAEWKLVPKPGATRRPVVERLRLRGYQTPQLFVETSGSSLIGSTQVSGFEGSFMNDSITLKLRQFGGGVVYDEGKAIVTSTGAN